MNNFVKTLVALAATMALTASANAAVHTAKRVVGLHADATRSCTLFMLEGVTQADPAKAGSPWFVLPRASASYAEVLAFLISARVSNLPLSVHTNGTTSADCDGYANVTLVGFD